MADKPGDLSNKFQTADTDTSVFVNALVNRSGSVSIGKIYIHDTEPMPEPEDSTLFGHNPLEFAKMDKDVQEAIQERFYDNQIKKFEEAGKLLIQTYQSRCDLIDRGGLAVELEGDLDVQANIELAMAMEVATRATFRDRVDASVKAGKSIERAVYEGFEMNIERARGNSVLEHVIPQYESMRDVMLRHLHPDKTVSVLEDAPDGSVIFCSTLAPSEVLGLVDVETGEPKFAGVVAKTGSLRGHSPSMSRSLGVSYAIVDPDDLPPVKNGYNCVIDADEKAVVLHPGKTLLDEFRSHKEGLDELRAELRSRSAKTRNVKTLDGTAVTFQSNFGSSREVSAYKAAHVSGVGLYRTEIAENMRSDAAPTLTKDDWKKIFRSNMFACSHKDGKPISMTVRTLDIAGDKAGRYAGKSPEAKAKIEEEATAKQIQALLELNRDLKAEGHKGKIKIMVPMIESPAHMKDWQDYADRMAEELECDPLKLGCMGEVPALFNELDDLDVSFISIGSNDLINGYLQTDRYHANSSELYDPTVPAFLEAVGKAVDYGEDKNVPVSICGDMASDPRYTVLAVGAGLRTLSTGLASAHIVKEIVKRIDVQEAEELFELMVNTQARSERERILDHFNETRLGLSREGYPDMDWSSESRRMFSVEDAVKPLDPGPHQG